MWLKYKNRNAFLITQAELICQTSIKLSICSSNGGFVIPSVLCINSVLGQRQQKSNLVILLYMYQVNLRNFHPTQHTPRYTSNLIIIWDKGWLTPKTNWNHQSVSLHVIWTVLPSLLPSVKFTRPPDHLSPLLPPHHHQAFTPPKNTSSSNRWNIQCAYGNWSSINYGTGWKCRHLVLTNWLLLPRWLVQIPWWHWVIVVDFAM